MPRYYHDHSYHHQIRFLRKARFTLIMLVLVAAAAGIYLVYDSIRAGKRANTPSKPTALVTSAYAVPVEVFSTKYFQFQADKNWTFIASESNDKKFVYRSLRKNFIEHEFILYVNSTDAMPEATHVLPVTLDADGTLVPDKASDHCKKVLKPTDARGIQMMTYMDVMFLCDPDANHYTVVVGLKGGKSSMDLSQPDGKTVRYGMIYRNVTAEPDDAEIITIVRSFQPR